MEVTVRLRRCGVYFIGETVRCRISVQCHSVEGAGESHHYNAAITNTTSGAGSLLSAVLGAGRGLLPFSAPTAVSPTPASLAVLSGGIANGPPGSPRRLPTRLLRRLQVQVQCIRASSRNWVDADSAALLERSILDGTGPDRNLTETASPLVDLNVPLDDSMKHVYSSPIQTIFSELQLIPGESRSVDFEHVLPENISVPTHRGTAVFYTYRIIILVESGEGVIKTIRMPFRVFSAPIGITQNESNVVEEVEIDEDEASRNEWWSDTSKRSIQDDEFMKAFKDVRMKMQTSRIPRTPSRSKALVTVESIMDTIAVNIAKEGRNRAVYGISNDDGLVCVCHLRKSAVRLGDDIQCSFDFTTSTVPCYRISASLVCVETIQEAVRLNPNQSQTSQVVAEQHILTASLSECTVSLVVPREETPSFASKIVEIHWLLRIQFTTAMHQSTANDGFTMTLNDDGLWLAAPQTVNTGNFIWERPITVHPTAPSNTSLRKLVEVITV